MICGLDTETFLIQPGRLAPPLVCASFAPLERPNAGDPKHVGWYVRTRDTAREEIERYLGRVPIVGHNMAYDMAVIAAQWPDLLSRIWAAYEASLIRCTMIREALHKIATGNLQHDAEDGGRPANLSLEACVRGRLQLAVEGKHGPDVWRLRYYELRDTPLDQWPDEARRYAGRDAEYAVRLFCAQASHHALAENYPDEHNQTRYHFALHLMACWGLRADAARVKALRATLEGRIAAAEVSLKAAGILKPDGSKTMKVIRDRVANAYADRGVPMTAPSATFPEGQVATASEVLAASGDPELETLARISEDEGELSKYVEHLEHAALAPMNARVTPLVATGRTSMSKPPLQQLPRRAGVRECIVARPGMKFVGADYSTQELVTWAQVCLWRFGFSDMAEVLQAGRDPHLVTACELMGWQYDDALRMKKDESAIKRRGEVAWKAYEAEVHARQEQTCNDGRNMAKPTNFGLIGGLGAESFCQFAWSQYGVRFTVDRAREVKNIFKGRYREAVPWFNWGADQTEAGGGSFTLEQPGSGRIRGAVRYTDGLNSQFQGLAADMSKRAVWYAARECFLGPGPLWGARVVLLMHDEIILEVPEAQASAAGERLSQIMRLAGAETCPDVPIKAEPWICGYWTKNAETRRDAAGQLIEWVAEAA